MALPSDDDHNEGETTTGILRLVESMSEKDEADRSLVFVLRRLAQHADNGTRALQRITEQNEEIKKDFDEMNGNLLRLAANLEANQASVLRITEEFQKLVLKVDRIRQRQKQPSFTNEEPVTGRHTPSLIAVATPMQAIPVQEPPSNGKKLTKSDLPKALDEVVRGRVGTVVILTVGLIFGAIATGVGTALVTSFLSHWH